MDNDRALQIDFLEERPLFGSGIEHRRMRGSGAEDDASHGNQSSPLSFPSALLLRTIILAASPVIRTV